MLDISIRNASLDDVTALIDFWRVNGDNGATRTETPELVTQLLNRDPDSIIVAELGGEIVGTTIAGWDGWRAAIYRVAVRSDLKQSGIGRQLINATVTRFRELGAPKVGGIVLETNTGAQQFYEKLGFVREDNCRRWILELN